MNKLYVAMLWGLFLVGCETTRTPLEPVEIKAAINQDLDEIARQDEQRRRVIVPDDVTAELLPELGGGDDLNLALVERRFDISAKNMTARQFFGSLLKGSKYNLIIHPDVSGRVTLVLNDATIEEAMASVADMYGYEIRLQGNTYHVYASGLRTETIPMNYLLMKRNGLSNSSISSGYLSDNDTDSSDSSDNNSNNDSGNKDRKNSSSSKSRNGTEISTQTDTDYWKELEKTLYALIGNKKDSLVIVSPQASLVTVRAYPNDIRKVRNYLAQAEAQLQRQVLLEVKIMEVTLSDGYEQGIEWNANNANVAPDSSFKFSIDKIADVITGGGALTLAGGDFSAAITLLKNQGDVNVLSSPRVTALNNQKAVIKVGTDEYFVTDYSTSTDTDTDTRDQDIELTPFFSGIALDVTPQIDNDGGVLLHVHPSIIEVTDAVKTIASNTDQVQLPVAKSDVRETDTVVKAKNGEIIIIGGLMKTAKKDLVAKMPFIGDIPFIGELFTNRSQSVEKTELVILIKPVVVDQNTWRLELERSSELLNKWYPEDSANTAANSADAGGVE